MEAWFAGNARFMTTRSRTAARDDLDGPCSYRPRTVDRPVISDHMSYRVRTHVRRVSSLPPLA
jgi:hypothetical protein